MKLTKVKKSKIENKEINSNFVYENKDKLFFVKEKFQLFHNMVFEKRQSNCEKVKYVSSMSFDEYAVTLAEICSKIANKPSILFLNFDSKMQEEISTKLGGAYKILPKANKESFVEYGSKNKPVATFVNENYTQALDDLYEAVGRDNRNQILVIFNKIDEMGELKRFGTFVILSRGMRISLIFNLQSKEQFIKNNDEIDYRSINGSCEVKLSYDENGIIKQ